MIVIVHPANLEELIKVVNVRMAILRQVLRIVRDVCLIVYNVLSNLLIAQFVKEIEKILQYAIVRMDIMMMT